ncbi:MAG TPA: membrane protein insertase YidC [Acetobacteraceae bacterium]|nr:membrane protein insertase YidC [Acetobacteraceae bacterium]
MDQKRLFFAIAISLAILLGFQTLIAPHLPKPPAPAVTHTTQTAQDEAKAPAAKTATPAENSPATAAAAAIEAVPKNVPRVKIAAQRLRGSISLLGARLDDLTLTDYRETLAPNSPDVRLLEPRSEPHPYFVQYGWTAAPGESVKLPGDDTVWTASEDTLTAGHPVTLSWGNGAGLTFQLILSVDDHYMFNVKQEVKNDTGQPVKLFPWARIRRDYTPATEGFTSIYGGVTEGIGGVVDDKLHTMTYSTAKSDGKKADGIAYQAIATGGWAGVMDKYWLTALAPDQSVPTEVTFRYIGENGDHYQVDYLAKQAETIAPGAEASLHWNTFAGAKVISLLDQYSAEYHIPRFNKAVDFGWFYLLAQPIFYCLDWLNALLGNFGVAIIAFTTGVKLVFFPLANYSYRSMSKMKLLGPKMTALRERFKDDPQKMQQEVMALYRAEKVNPASGCLPMIVQIPVFCALYVVIFTTIEMRHAPFFGWIHDLSAPDPTNLFNLFGLLPFNPAAISSWLHMGAWPLIMGCTMFLQQKLNPPPPDPVQARLFQFMPVIFTFMLANFPAGLVIYWSWNNMLSIGQQWLIMRRTRLTKPSLART